MEGKMSGKSAAEIMIRSPAEVFYASDVERCRPKQGCGSKRAANVGCPRSRSHSEILALPFS
jgi:hypothetical protein